MIDVLIITFLIACTAVFMVNYNEPYLNILKKLKLNLKPFNCTVCFSIWLGLFYTLVCYTHLACLLIAPCSALFAIAIEKLVKMLPIIF